MLGSVAKACYSDSNDYAWQLEKTGTGDCCGCGLRDKADCRQLVRVNASI